MVQKTLKAIIMNENRMKDPFRIKKGVTFMIALDGDDNEEESGGEDNTEDE